MSLLRSLSVVTVSVGSLLLLAGCGHGPQSAGNQSHVHARVEGATVAGGPRYAVDALWPKPLPNNWILGQVAGIAIDRNDTIWLIHRPLTLTDDEKGAALTPPRSKCCVAAPPARRSVRSAAPDGRPATSTGYTTSKSIPKDRCTPVRWTPADGRNGSAVCSSQRRWLS